MVNVNFRKILPEYTWLPKLRETVWAKLILVQEFVIEDAGCNLRQFDFICRRFFWRIFFGPRNSALAKYRAVFLTGNFFRHLKNHFHQRVIGKTLWTKKEHAGLAQIGNRAFVPTAEIFHTVAHWSLDLQEIGR